MIEAGSGHVLLSFPVANSPVQWSGKFLATQIQLPSPFLALFSHICDACKGIYTGLWSGILDHVQLSGILRIQDVTSNYSCTPICRDSLDSKYSDHCGSLINLREATGNCQLIGGKLTFCTTFILCPKEYILYSVRMHPLSQEMPNRPISKQIPHVSSSNASDLLSQGIPHILCIFASSTCHQRFQSCEVTRAGDTRDGAPTSFRKQ